MGIILYIAELNVAEKFQQICTVALTLDKGINR